jgi:putative heme iron utilization protein
MANETGTGTRRSGAAQAAGDILERARAGVLATISVKHGGAPFASLASYALGPSGEVVFLFSTLAQHTRNLAADARATLYVQDPSQRDDDPQQVPRVAIVGRVVSAAGDEADALLEAYLDRHPQAKGLVSLDFAPYRLVAEQIHYVGGFASATWLDPADVLAP